MIRLNSRARASSSKNRRVRLTVDRLEAREVLSTASAAGFVAKPMFDVGSLVAYNTPPASAYTPAQIKQAYNFNGISFGSINGDGSGQTIAIVDAYSDPNIQADLNTFDTQFGLPATTVTQVNQTGGTSLPATDSTGGWELEEALDVEWAHAMAPGAKILLVAAASASDADLLPAVNYAASHANVVSMSWGGGEFSGETTYDSYFSHAGVAFVASSGDNGAPISWPAASPNVVAVGGTSLYLGTGGSYGSEAGWSGSGGGPSAYVARPSYQNGVVTQTTQRANPDVAYNASPNTGFAVYDSFQYNGTSDGWMQLGGTSAGAPQWAALLAIADQGRALGGLSPLNSASPQQVLTTLYQNATSGDFHDVTSGTSTGQPNYSAGVGYDYVTGLGSPLANMVVQSLDGGTTTPPATPDSLTVSGPAAATAGASFNFTVTAKTSAGATDGGYTGTVRFTSSDAQAGLPSSYTFTAADAGSHTFTVTLKTAGQQSVTAADTTTGSSASDPSITVSPAAATRFVLSGLASSETVGVADPFTLTAKDAYGNVATGYTGTVRFSSSDAGASLPGNYTFVAADKGAHAFSVTFGTAGTQSVTVADITSGVNVSQGGIAVSPAAPVNLAAKAVSSSEIDLTWNGSAGATGYSIQRSTNGGSSWSTLATTAAGTTSYQDKGLASGTTYTYRVRANGGNGSGYSNIVSATTTGTAPVSTATDSLWSDSYVPNENAYASGAYEVGMRFSTDVAGTVTGVRFYKQSWMNGYTHVGHLWSANGALLASVTFTGETGSGWQKATFSNPVSLTPGATYEISFSSGGGYFGITTNSFGSAGVTNGPLHALPNLSTNGGNGVYGAMNSFPTVNGNGMNFWVDVVFTPTSTSAFSIQTSTASAATTPNVPAEATTTASKSASSTPAASPRTTSAATSSHGRTVAQAQGYNWNRRYGNWSY